MKSSIFSNSYFVLELLVKPAHGIIRYFALLSAWFCDLSSFLPRTCILGMDPLGSTVSQALTPLQHLNHHQRLDNTKGT